MHHRRIYKKKKKPAASSEVQSLWNITLTDRWILLSDPCTQWSFSLSECDRRWNTPHQFGYAIMFINLSLQNLNAYQNELTNPVAADERACLWVPLCAHLKDQNLLIKCTEMTDVWCGITAANAFIFSRLVVVGSQKKKKKRQENFKGTRSWWSDRWQMMNGCALRNVYVICLIHCHCECRRQRDGRLRTSRKIWGGKNEKAQGRTHAETQIG